MEHSAEKGGGSQVLSEPSRISRLERQAHDFLNAVLHRKDLPSLSEPHIPLVAREIMQRMIRQFAAEYTSKTTQDASPPPPNGTMKDLPRAAPLSSNGTGTSNGSGGGGTAAASAQNPVLSKLLMADQDGPLDLSVKKNEDEEPEPSQP
ncbi:hypothetical protein KUCAC02_031702, partial [Chaenocephalus aceratus]